jgi:hypothetical protein
MRALKETGARAMVAKGISLQVLLGLTSPLRGLPAFVYCLLEEELQRDQ